MQTLTLTAPDDWHLHVRDGSILKPVVTASAHQFARALIMPNLTPAITTTEQAQTYAQHIRNVVPTHFTFEPLMSIYLTDQTSIDEVKKAADTPDVIGFKLYPAGITTNSASGVTDLDKLTPVFEAMAQQGMVLQVHAEVNNPMVDIFDREAIFIDQLLAPLHNRLPQLKIIIEHVTTRQGIEFVYASSAQIAATLTAHHLLLNRNAMFADGLRPHHYCLPVLKRESHRLALLEAATSGNPAFFLGTDSAPHRRHDKESGCGCAGIYTAENAMALYATAFEQCNALGKLENFSSYFGAQFYGLKTNSKKITLVRTENQVKSQIPVDDDVLIPFMAGSTLNWSIQTTA